MKKNHVFVTGASRGLGLEFCRRYLEQGSQVTALVRNAIRAKALVDLKEKNPESLSLIELDLKDRDLEYKLKVQMTKPIDVLINNAGVLYEQNEGFKTLSVERIRESFEVNTIVPLLVTRACDEVLKKGAKLISISSKMGSIEDCTSGFAYSYRMSKTALNMLNKCLSTELSPRGITAIVMHPGWVKTDMGGPQAPLDDVTSVLGMMTVIEKLTPQDAGKFLQYDGQEIPW